MPGYPEILRDVLNEHHLEQFKGFCCGDDPWERDLDEFLRENALPEADERLNKTYVFYSTAREPVAFVTLSSSHIEKKRHGRLPIFEKTVYPAIPAILLGRFGVDRAFQRGGYGTVIMRWVKEMGRSMEVGCRFIALDVDNDNKRAISFYEREGFAMTPARAMNRSVMLYDLVASGRQEDGGGGT